MFTKRLLGAAAFAFCALYVGQAYAGEWITPDRNLPVTPDYKEIGDQKYNDRMYSDYYTEDTFDGTGRLNTTEDLLGPDRNLPVRNDFKDVNDRMYTRQDYRPPYVQAPSGFTPAPNIAPGQFNLPVDNDYRDIGDPNFGDRQTVRP